MDWSRRQPFLTFDEHGGSPDGFRCGGRATLPLTVLQCLKLKSSNGSVEIERFDLGISSPSDSSTDFGWQTLKVRA